MAKAVIRLLLDHGADPALTTEEWPQTPYELARREKYLPVRLGEDVVRLLRPPDPGRPEQSLSGP